jgi:Zn finger protein HypA/HybF involved in hydrogenase expression
VHPSDWGEERNVPTAQTLLKTSAVVHELSIAMSLVDAVCEELPRLGGASVRVIRIRVGAMSGVSPDALLFAFDAATDGSAIAGSSLEIEATDGCELEVVSLEVIDAVSADR